MALALAYLALRGPKRKCRDINGHSNNYEGATGGSFPLLPRRTVVFNPAKRDTGRMAPPQKIPGPCRANL